MKIFPLVWIITVGIVLMPTVGHTAALLLWMKRYGKTLSAQVIDLTSIGNYGRGTHYRFEVEFIWQDETRRILTLSSCQFGALSEKRMLQKKLDRWQGRNVEILYSPEIPKWLAVRGPREVAYIKKMIWKDVLFAGMGISAYLFLAVALILKM